jgi:hypothetical protein
MTEQAGTLDLEAKVRAAQVRRQAKIAEHAANSARTRLENEAKLADLETELGRTVGVDLAVVWLRNGGMVVVGKPRQITYEKFTLKQANGEVSAQDITQFLQPPTVLYPEALRLESLWEAEPEAKFAAVKLALQLCQADQESYLGK